MIMSQFGSLTPVTGFCRLLSRGFRLRWCRRRNGNGAGLTWETKPTGVRAEDAYLEESSLSYAEMQNIEAGLRFKTRAGLVVETTGVTQSLASNDVNVHEVVIVEGEGEGNKYLHNLDYAEKV